MKDGTYIFVVGAVIVAWMTYDQWTAPRCLRHHYETEYRDMSIALLNGRRVELKTRPHRVWVCDRWED